MSAGRLRKSSTSRRSLAAVTAAGILGVALPARAGAADEAPAPVKSDGADKHASDSAAPAKLVVVWPTFTPAGDDASPTPLHRPSPSEEPLATRARELDATLRDATQDLGFVLDLADAEPRPGHVRDLDMLARAGRARPGDPSGTGTWVVSARLEQAGSESFLLRVIAAPPNAKELRVREEIVKGAEVSLRGLVLLRDLLAPAVPVATTESCRPAAPALDASVATPSHSPGRAVLATNGALFGGYLGYSLVRSAGTSDPRVLYPLLTLGAAVGIGGALLASEEWDVSTGDAWFLSAGAWWGAGAGVLLANGTNSQSTEGPYAWGIGGGLAGLALGTFALTRSKMDEGDAVLTHSGAGLGMWIGALAELGYRGSTSTTPYLGAGLGSAIGLVGAGAASIFVTIPPSRVLLLDLGAGLGSLAGAAVGSPLIFSDLTGSNTNPTRTRIFLAGTLAGTAAGGTAAWFLTRSGSLKKPVAWNGMPSAGIIGQSVTPTGQVPAYGLMYSGTF
jgi:hypothetical protein